MKYILSILLLLTSTQALAYYTTNAEAEQDAARAISEAFYKQSGIESNVSNMVKDAIPKKYEATITNVTTLINTAVTKRISVTWTF